MNVEARWERLSLFGQCVRQEVAGLVRKGFEVEAHPAERAPRRRRPALRSGPASDRAGPVPPERPVPRSQARPAKSSVSVWTFTRSPSLTKRGTRISIPVSSVAAFVTPPLDVSPRWPGSV